MTLKARLATIMILLLLGVLALQYVLASREQQELAHRISELSSEVNTSTRELALLAHATQAGNPLALSPDSARMGLTYRMVSVGRDAERRELRYEAVFSESLHVPIPPRLADSVTVKVVEFSRDTVIAFADGPVGDHARGTPIDELVTQLDTDERLRWIDSAESSAAGGAIRTMLQDFDARFSSAGERSIQIYVPFPSATADSLTFVEMKVPTDTLTDALDRARRRSLIWLTSLLGVGVIGATVLAGQFTRPIRTLEQSFRRVEAGDLSVEVAPERNDEIGRLTTSFNHMVGRLRESQTMERRLADAERLAAMGRLAAGVAHEVRNPLNAIQLNVQQMRDKAAPPAGTPERRDFDRYTSTVSSEVRRLESVVGAFLDLSRSEAVDDLQPVNVTETVGASVELFAADATDRGIELTLTAPDPHWCEGDPTRLPMVWNNLLANALAATPSGGRVEVAVRRRNETVHVTIADTGVGMTEEALGHMWDPFYSGRADGTGLGLTIVRSVTERHGGTVEAESTPGAGTRIRVTLPALAPPDPAPSNRGSA